MTLTAVPERIPDVSLSRYPYLSSKQSAKLRVHDHERMQRERCCHAFEGREYHYCGRTEGRVFPLADLSRPEPTLPNPNVPLGGGIPLWLGISYMLLLATILAIAIWMSR